jgi:pimeloyl-ACP methyl ester carboxylesterase
MRNLLTARATPGAPPDPTTFANDGRGFVDRIPESEGLPDWLTEADVAFYADTFTRTGFTGGINWYRNLDRNWELTASVADAHVTAPSLFIGGGDDPVLLMTAPSIADGWLDDHRGDVIVPGAGHWVQQEDAEAVNAALLRFLDSLDLPGRA